MEQIKNIVEGDGLTFVGWRDVPVKEEVLGANAREARPYVGQFFVKVRIHVTPPKTSVLLIVDRIQRSHHFSFFISTTNIQLPLVSYKTRFLRRL